MLLALAASDGVARDIVAEHGAREGGLRERLASLIEPGAPEIAAKLRTRSAEASADGRAPEPRCATDCSRVCAMIERYRRGVFFYLWPTTV